MDTANILPVNKVAITVVGNNINQESSILTFTNNSAVASGSISDIQLSNNPTSLTLTTSGINNPCRIGNGQTNTLAPMQSCNVLLQLGPEKSVVMVTGTALLNYNYVNYAPLGIQAAYESINYSITPESLNFIIKSVSSNVATGDGSISAPYVLSGSKNGQTITVTYQNVSSESVVVQSFSSNYGTAGALGTYWVIADNCSGDGNSLAPNATCTVTYTQNFYRTAAQNNYNCNGTNQDMSINSPTVLIKSSSTQEVYTFANLVYPTSLSTTLTANLSNIYILNNLSVANSGIYADNPNYNIYASAMTSSITNASGYTAFTLNTNMLLNSGFGGQAVAPQDISTIGLGTCSATDAYTTSALYNQTCTYNSESIYSGNLAESYVFYAQPYSRTNAWYYYQNVSLSGNATQTYCMQSGSNYLQLN